MCCTYAWHRSHHFFTASDLHQPWIDFPPTPPPCFFFSSYLLDHISNIKTYQSVTQFMQKWLFHSEVSRAERSPLGQLKAGCAEVVVGEVWLGWKRALCGPRGRDLCPDLWLLLHIIPRRRWKPIMHIKTHPLCFLLCSLPRCGCREHLPGFWMR